jgi:Ca2+/H+ antiporter
MKIFSAPARPANPLDRPTARACVLTNLLVLPGLGTLIAGKRTGYAQATLALTGFILTMLWAVRLIAIWIRTNYFPCTIDTYFWIGMTGAALFAIGWLWALASSLRILRVARTTGV